LNMTNVWRERLRSVLVRQVVKVQWYLQHYGAKVPVNCISIACLAARLEIPYRGRWGWCWVAAGVRLLCDWRAT